MKTSKERKKEFVTMFGQQIPKWKDCPECGSKLSCEFMTYSHASCCPKCKEKKIIEDNETTFIYHRFKEITSIFKEKKTGQLVGVDGKGKKVEMKNTRYDLKNDRYGWQATGHKVRR